VVWGWKLKSWTVVSQPPGTLGHFKARESA